jgi:aminopeptidase N
MSDKASVLDDVKRLLTHPSYDAKNPNNIRSLIGGFSSNISYFHHLNSSGYIFLAEQILSIDRFNPMVASGLMKRFAIAPKLDAKRQVIITEQINYMLGKNLSTIVEEIARKIMSALL